MVCLTGNACRWKRNIPIDGPNSKVKFALSYKNAPDYVSDKGQNLFNRKQALASKLIQGKKLNWQKVLSKWAVAWKNNKPADIAFKFDHPVDVSLVKLWLHGGYNEISVSANGKKLASFKRKKGGEPEVDVDEVSISFKPVKTRELTIHLGPRFGITWLSELELWSPRFFSR